MAALIRKRARVIELKALCDLSEIYCSQQRWPEAKSTQLKLLDCQKRDSGKDTDKIVAGYCWLTKILYKSEDYVDAMLYGRSALLRARKLGNRTLTLLSVELLVEICKASHNDVDREAYSALLDDIRWRQEQDDDQLAERRVERPVLPRLMA